MSINKIDKILSKNFPSLYHRDFRLFFFGQLISLIGTWMQVMAQAWLVYSMTNSAFKLGLVAAMQSLPIMFFSLFAGVIIDKSKKKKILIITQSILMLQAASLYFLFHFGVIEYWHIIILALILGLVNTIDVPTRQAFVIQLIGRKDIVNAVGLNSAAFNLARIIGPSIAGILMAGLGMSWCFLINTLSFIPVIASLFLIKQSGAVLNSVSSRKIRGQIKDGLLYIYKNSKLFNTLIFILFITVFGFNYNVLTPVFAKAVLGMEEKGFGILLSCFGFGSLLGALITSLMPTKQETGQIISSAIFLGFALIVMGFTKHITTASIAISFCGFFGVRFFTLANSVLQLNAEDIYRGRVMSVYALVLGGSMPIGNFFTGLLAEHIGASYTFVGAGAFIALVLIVIKIRNRNKVKMI